MAISPEEVFNREHASSYDSRWKPVAALTDALHLLSRSALAGLRDNARILCAGAGTGAEILYLGAAFPGWRFVGFDPAAAMLDVCRARLEAAGLSGRCELYHGYIDAVPESAPFDAATSFLVSHFLTDDAARGAYFRAIARRLASGGLFVNADLAADRNNASYTELMKIWLATLSLAGMDAAGRRRYEEMFGVDVAAHSPREVEALLAENGFPDPVRFYQTAMIHGWLCRRA